MLTGTADLQTLAERAPTIDAFSPDDLHLEDVLCLQLTAEMRNSAREAVLPSALHPTIPAALSIQAYQVGRSPWGAFAMATCRVSCRSGVRARGFTTATFASTAEATQGLRQQIGFPAATADVSIDAGYAASRVSVELDGRRILQIDALDPEPMALDDVQYTGTMNLANTPLGLRLLQVESTAQSSRVERLTARQFLFDGAAWGNPLLQPTEVIATTVAHMTLTLPAVRFVCRADELAFTGTEKV